MRRSHRKGHGRKGRRGGHVHRIHNPDWKILAFAGAAGVVAAIGAGYLVANVNFFQKYWYATPLAFVAGGVLLLKKMPTIGIALGAAGGLLGYYGYVANKSLPVPPAAGFTDAGRLGMRQDSGLFERGAGAIMGSHAPHMRMGQGAGAIMGRASNTFRRTQAAAGFTDAGGVPAPSFD